MREPPEDWDLDHREFLETVLQITESLTLATTALGTAVRKRLSDMPQPPTALRLVSGDQDG